MRQQPGIQLVDIAHNISKYNLQQAAYVLKNAYHFFPDHSLHLLDVASISHYSSEFIYFSFNEHHFIMPDNGICSLITENALLSPYIIPASGRPKPHAFSLLIDVLPALQPILQGENAAQVLGEVHVNYNQLTPLLPAITGDNLQGRVIHVDAYENVITNIDRQTFRRLTKGNNGFIIHLKKKYQHENRVEQLVNSYEEVGPGEIACFFGHNNLLQISIRGGNASGLLGLRVDDPIFIEKT